MQGVARRVRLGGATGRAVDTVDATHGRLARAQRTGGAWRRGVLHRNVRVFSGTAVDNVDAIVHTPVTSHWQQRTKTKSAGHVHAECCT